jgi:hypothetical protein
MGREIFARLDFVPEPGYRYFLRDDGVYRALVQPGGLGKATRVVKLRLPRDGGSLYQLQGTYVVRSSLRPEHSPPVGGDTPSERQVARELVAAHEEWRAQSAGPGAEEAATLALRGCRQAVLILAENLRYRGYPVARLVQESPPDLDALLVGFRVRVPPLLRLFWREVGAICLVDLENYRHTLFWLERKIKAEYCDGVLVGLPSKVLIEDDNILLAPDGYHKDNISGGAPYSMAAGDAWWAPIQASWGGPRQPLSAPRELDLLGYLRTAILECAGFPGLLGDPVFEVLRPRLLEGVPHF